MPFKMLAPKPRNALLNMPCQKILGWRVRDTGRQSVRKAPCLLSQRLGDAEDREFKVNLDYLRISLKKNINPYEKSCFDTRPFSLQLVSYEESRINSAAGAEWQAVRSQHTEKTDISFEERWQPQPWQPLSTQSSLLAVLVAAQY